MNPVACSTKALRDPTQQDANGHVQLAGLRLLAPGGGALSVSPAARCSVRQLVLHVFLHKLLQEGPDIHL